MVFFNCNACGEAVKKAQVEKHYMFKCRGCTVLSCVDCGKDFPGETYKEHVKCMTEDEKYGGKNFKPKANANKGEKKQEAWTEQVEAAIDKVKEPRLKALLVRIKGFTNIPRKKAKFENFLRNSIRVQGDLPARAWDAISAEIPKPEESKAAEETNGHEVADESTTNGVTEEKADKKLSKREKKEERQKHTKKEKKDRKNAENVETDEVKQKKGKRKRDEDEDHVEDAVSTKKKKKKHATADEPLQESVITNKKKKEKQAQDSDTMKLNETLKNDEDDELIQQKFNWDGMIVGLLKKAGGELSVKKLRKKVLSAYQQYSESSSKTEEQILGKFNKKVARSDRFKLAKERVTLK